MTNSDRQPPAEPELAWLLHSAMVWALTGALITLARRPPWHAVGMVLTVLGIGVAGWVVRRRLRGQAPRQQTNGIFPYRLSRPSHKVPLRRQGGRHERVPARPRVWAVHRKRPPVLPGGAAWLQTRAGRRLTRTSSPAWRTLSRHQPPSSARSPVSSSKHLRPLVVPPGPRSILDRILLRRRLNPRANEPGASTRAGQPVWAGRLAGQVGADRSGGGGERSDAGEGAVAFAMTAFDQQDCPHENPPPSRCSRSAIRLRGLPLPTRRHRAGGALVSADGDGVGPDEARPGQVA